MAGVVLVAILLACAWLQPMDAPATAQVDSGLKRALATYATARLLHGAVSVLQGTQVDAAPAGVGATFTPGQILAPAAEILRQFSDVMLLICVSFGIQKLLITMGGAWAISLCLTLAAIGWAYQLMRQRAAPNWLSKILIVLILVRFAVPLTVIGSDYLFEAYMNNDYQSSQQALTSASAGAATFTSPETPESSTQSPPSSWDNFKNWFKSPTTTVVSRYEGVKEAVNQWTDHAVKLIAIFILQTMVLPLLFLFGLYGLTRVALQITEGRSYRPKLPV